MTAMSSDPNGGRPPAGTTTEAEERPAGAAADRAAGQPDAAMAGTVAELEDRWRRALADLDNLRKRYARELLSERATERDQVAAAFLPVVDNLELALAHAGSDPDAVTEGVRAVRDQAVQVLERLGYPRVDAVGVPFDPLLHEVMQVVTLPDDRPEGRVEQVLRPGYGRAERLLRPAAVAVGRRRE
jgi:molecular chaperone GrpE